MATQTKNQTKVTKEAKPRASKATKQVKVAKATVKPAKAKSEAAAKPRKTRTVSEKVAVLQINNMQYIVKTGETIPTRIALDANSDNLEVKLLALVDGENFEFGKPFLENKIDFSLGEMVKAEKVTAIRFKAKARYRRKVGQRAKYIEFTLNSIS